LAAPRATLFSTQFVHMRWEGVEAFWRPFDLLASSRLTGVPGIRMLVSGDLAAEGDRCPAPRMKLDCTAAGRRTCAVEPQHGRVALEEIADLLRTMAIRAQGYFCLHAATVADGERAAVLMGPSGCGKTTTALALARGGFELQGDENSMLSAASGRVQVAGFRTAPRIVGQAPATLDSLESTLNLRTAHKSAMTLPGTAPNGGTRWVTPAAIFFLRVHHGERDHTVRGVPAEEAFVRTTDQVLDPTNVFRREEQAQALIGLVERCPAYELALGTNLASLPILVRRIMGEGA
jgi:hypothetical protein